MKKIFRWIFALLAFVSTQNAVAEENGGLIDWLDETFFGFDSTYVHSYPTRLTLTLQSKSWIDMYTFDIDKENQIKVKSDYLSDISFSVGYGFLSVGYTLGMNKITGDKDAKYNRVDMSLKCNMAALDLSSATNESETTLSAVHNGEESSVPFRGFKMNMQEVSATYYFKYRKYANEAAYSSSYPYRQVRSAGSPIIGLYYGKHDITCDLTKIPQESDFVLPENISSKRIRNEDFGVNGGYGYNFVFAEGWVLNGTILPAIGMRIHDDDSSDKYQLTANGKLKVGCTYNSRYFFAGLTLQYSNYTYISKESTIYNSIGAGLINVGVRL